MMREKIIDKLISNMVQLPARLGRMMNRQYIRDSILNINSELSPHHLMILYKLKEHGDLSMGNMADETQIVGPQMTHSADKLIDLGLIERTFDTSDRRKVMIRLTENGISTMSRIDNVMRHHIKDGLKTLTDDELQTLAESLENIDQLMSKMCKSETD